MNVVHIISNGSPQIHKKVPLQGDELEEFLAKERAVKEKEAAHQAALARTQRMLEADEGQSDSDSDDEDESDDDEEDEVERELGEDLMDTTDDLKRSRQGPNATTRSGTKRKRGEGGGGDGTDWVLGNEADEGATRISFDIYLKGNVAKATSFFKSADGQTQRFRMFPYVEKKRKVDEYGETVDVGMWLRKGKVLEEDAEDEETKDARRRKEEEEAKVSEFFSLAQGAILMCLSESTTGTTFKIRDVDCGGAAGLSLVIC